MSGFFRTTSDLVGGYIRWSLICETAILIYRWDQSQEMFRDKVGFGGVGLVFTLFSALFLVLGSSGRSPPKFKNGICRILSLIGFLPAIIDFHFKNDFVALHSRLAFVTLGEQLFQTLNSAQSRLLDKSNYTFPKQACSLTFWDFIQSHSRGLLLVLKKVTLDSWLDWLPSYFPNSPFFRLIPSGIMNWELQSSLWSDFSALLLRWLRPCPNLNPSSHERISFSLESVGEPFSHFLTGFLLDTLSFPDGLA